MESEFRANAAALGNWANDASGLEMRIATLTDKMELQKVKVEALRAEYERIKEEKGEDALATDQAAIKYNKAREELGMMESELRKTEGSLSEMKDSTDQTAGEVDELGDQEKEAEKSTKELGDSEEDAEEKTNKFGGAIKALGDAAKVGAAALAATAAAAVGVVAAITDLVLNATEAAGELVDLSLKTGISTERLQEMKYIGDQVGTSLETMTGSMAKMTRSMSDAATNAEGPAAKAFAALGVAVVDANGNLRDTEDVFADAIDALGDVENATEADALAMDIFGKSALELNPLIKTGSEELAALAEEANEVGAVMDEEAVAGLESFGDTLASLKSGLEGTLGMLASAIVPAFQGLTGTAQTYLGQFSEIVRGADGDLGAMADGLGGLLGDMIADIATQVPGMIDAALSLIKSLADALISALPEIMPAVVQILESLVNFLVEMAPMLLEAGITIVMTLLEALLDMLPDILEAGIEILLALIEGLTDALPDLIEMVLTIIPEMVMTLIGMLPELIQSAVEMIVAIITGLVNALPQLIAYVPEIILALVGVLIENLPMVIEAAIEIILAVIQGLVDAIPQLIAYVPEIIVAIVDAIVLALPLIAQAAVDIILALIEGIGTMLPEIGKAAGDIIGTLSDAVIALAASIAGVGETIVTGIWSGISGMADWFYDQIKSFFANLIAAAKESLGIESPSKVFASIGENMALGLGQGFGKSFDDIARQVRGQMEGLGNMDVNLTGAAAGGSGASPSISVPVTAYVGNNIDLYRLAWLVADEIQRRS
jgi:phage-related protein